MSNRSLMRILQVYFIFVSFFAFNYYICPIAWPNEELKNVKTKERRKKKSTEDEINFLTRYEVRGHCKEVDIWFSNAVGRPCTLVRSYGFQNHVWSNRDRNILGMRRDVETRLNFVNEAQFLLISEESVADLNNRLRSSTSHAFSFPCYNVLLYIPKHSFGGYRYIRFSGFGSF